MDDVIAIFLVAAVVIVPLGYRLVEVPAPRLAPPAFTRVGMVVAGGLLALSFAFPPGLAALLVIPWLVLTSFTAIATVARLVGSHDRWWPGPNHAVVAALGFLAIGASFSFADRLGIQPFGFPATVILLTAIHFHFAGFVLPLAGALAFTRRSTPWIAIATSAVIVGIPTTAIGFFGVPIANWTGAMATAIGGLGIGLATIAVSRTLSTRPAAILAVISGLSLLISMPLAVVFATGTLLGSGWLTVGWMAAVHGTLNAFGFALLVTMAWTLERRAIAPVVPPQRRPRMSVARRWAIGFVTGLAVGVGVLVTGVVGGILGILALLLLTIEPERDAPVGGLFLGGGLAWLGLFGTAQIRCGPGCTAPDVTPWLTASIAMLAIGLGLSWRSTRRRLIPDRAPV